MFTRLCDSSKWIVKTFLWKHYHQYSIALAGAMGEKEYRRGQVGSCIKCLGSAAAPAESSKQYSAVVAEHFSWPHGLVFPGRNNGLCAHGSTTLLQLHQGITSESAVTTYMESNPCRYCWNSILVYF